MFRRKSKDVPKYQPRDISLTNHIGVIAEEKADDEDMHGKALAQELFEQIQHTSGKSELDLQGFKDLIKLVNAPPPTIPIIVHVFAQVSLYIPSHHHHMCLLLSIINRLTTRVFLMKNLMMRI